MELGVSALSRWGCLTNFPANAFKKSCIWRFSNGQIAVRLMINAARELELSPTSTFKFHIHVFLDGRYSEGHNTGVISTVGTHILYISIHVHVWLYICLTVFSPYSRVCVSTCLSGHNETHRPAPNSIIMHHACTSMGNK